MSPDDAGRREHPERLERPAGEVVRELALARLEEARDALVRVGDERDRKGLHDFRVALRRLRSLLQAYGDAFEAPVRALSLRRLRGIGAQTGAARDAEAQLEWLGRNLRSPSRGLRAARAALAHALEARKRSGYARVRGAAVSEFLALSGELRDACVGHRAGAPAPAPGEPFGRLSGRKLAQALHALERQLELVHALADEEPAHQARIAAKRVRYVLEPLRGTSARAEQILERLRELQDLLGELNDLRALRSQVRALLERAALERVQARLASVQGEPADASGSLPGALLENGGLAVAQRIEQRRRELFGPLAEHWLRGAGREFFELAQGLLAELLGLGAPHVEIERKYLLKELPKLPGGSERIEIAQGYLGEGAVRERLRRARTPGAVRHYRTVKIGRGERRVEFEDEISESEFERLWPQTAGCRVEKLRHRVPSAQGTWEIDEFTDRELVLAELELGEAGAQPEIPDWLAPAVLRDVTDDPAYTNLSLACTER